ncbi:Rha family transcriptional regulator [Achromobacter xylosoxidans]|uniref:Rha family transcriptional regulator n=1 Tax=Alcaligenes xylosoxydans xylosoxydans TaxID=85698 RepID=UPI001EEAB122|nr:Rha family transcriptional regulator [Achromobacter xylosoxidans]
MGNSQRALALTPSPDIKQSHGRPVTTSKSVASVFGKRHADVLRSAVSLATDCPREWYERNFALIQIPVDLGLGRTRKDPAYEITRDGFVLLVMGFTGKQALQFKIAYLERFNEMERQLGAQQRDQTWNVSGAPDGTWAVVIENGIQRLVPLIHLYRQHYDADGQHVPMANTKPEPRAQPQQSRAHVATPYIRNQSGERGVYPNQSKYNPWRAYVQRDGVSYNLGTYPTIAAARAAREQAMIDIAAGRLPVARRLGGPRR